MGEGTPHVTGASARVIALGAEATAARERLDVLIAELRRRRDELMDWRTQLRRHRRGLTIVLGGVVALAGAGLALQIARSRRQAGLAALALGVLLLVVGGAIGLVAWRGRLRAPLAATRTHVKEDLE